MHTTREGQLVTQQLSTEQVHRLIRDPHFDLQAQASHTKNGHYRSLAAYPEFAPTLRGRLGKEKADRKSTTIRSAYQDIIDSEDKRKRKRKWRYLFDRLTSGAGALIGLAIIAGLIIGGYLLFTQVLIKD